MAAWEARLRGDTSNAEARFDAARELAQARGYRCLPAARVADFPLDQMLDRMDQIVDRQGRVNMREADASLGLAPKPKVTINRALELFWSLAQDRVDGKTNDQLRRWRNPRIKAVGFAVSVIGDLELAAITADDMLEYRDAL